jgi:2-hydroxychromene-2-carboxylate isomerase
MIRIDWYFDVISPFAYLAFERLPGALAEVSEPFALRYRPVLFAALLDHFGHKGPAEIPSKRRFTFEQVAWLARRDGVPLRAPRQHPFNPLPLLRAMLAAAGTDHASRAHAQAAFHYVWQQGRLPDEPEFAALLAQLGIAEAALAAPEVKAALRANTDAAIADEVFGVPTAVVRMDGSESHRFWGFDALPMMAAYLNGDPFFRSEALKQASRLPAGVQRKAVRA